MHLQQLKWMWNSKLWKGYYLSISYTKRVPFLPKMVYKRLRGCTLWQSLPVKLCWVHPPPLQDPNPSLQVLRVFNFCQVMKKYIMVIYHSQYVMFLFFWEADLSMWFVKVLVLIFLKSFSVVRCWKVEQATRTWTTLFSEFTTNQGY